MSKRKRGSKAFNKLKDAHNTQQKEISSIPPPPSTFTLNSSSSIFIFILPQSSNDTKGQSITFEYQGFININTNSFEINLNELKNLLFTKYQMNTPRLAFHGYSIPADSSILKCRVGDTLICYDIFDNDSEQEDTSVSTSASSFNNTSSTPHIIDLDGENEVIDLLSDSDDDVVIDTDSTTASVTNASVANASVTNDSDLAQLISMGFNTDVARQALQTENGNVSAAAQRLLDGGGSNYSSNSSNSSNTQTKSTSTSTSSSSSSISSTSKRQRQHQNKTPPSIFDGHLGIRQARNYIATATAFDEKIACQELPRKGILLEQVSTQPIQFFEALYRTRDDDGEDNQSMPMETNYGEKIYTTIKLSIDQAADLAMLEEEFEDSNLHLSEIRQMFVVMNHNVAATRALLLQ